MAEAKRNQTADVIRGIAILLVILGHTLTGCGIESPSNTFLFRIIWALQMPLFMLVSGYVSLYSAPITCGREFLRYLGKRSLTYLLPWFVWTFGMGLLRQNCTIGTLLPYMKHILFHMDSGYWFLVSLWSICLIFGLSQWISAKANRCTILFHLICAGIFAALLAALAYVAGTAFLGLRYTLYYLPFFYAGYLFHLLSSRFRETKWFSVCSSAAVFLSLCFFAVSISRFNSFSAGDGLLQILHRAAQSLSGCIVLATAADHLCRRSSRLTPALSRLGQTTLELYLTHGLFLNLLPSQTPLSACSIDGLELLLVNFLITVLLSLLFSRLLHLNKYSRLLLFGKHK